MKNVFLILIGLCAAVLAGQTYYVSPDGDNANPGTREAPWANPGWAMRQMQGGDDLILLPGAYVPRQFDGDILQPPAGTYEDATLILAEQAGTAVLAGADNLFTLIDLSGAEYVMIQGLELTNHQGAYVRDGITATAAPCNHIILSDLHIHHLDEFGINLRDVDNLTITGCNIHHCGFGAVGGPEAEAGGWQKVDILHTNLSYSGHYYRNGEAENPYGRPDGFGIEPGPGPITFWNCTLEHNHGDGLDSKADTTLVSKTIIANNRTDGLKLWGGHARVENTLIYGRGDGDPTPTPWSAVVIDTEHENANFEFLHCTIDDSLGRNYVMWAQYDHPEVPIQVSMTNCIISSRGPRSSVFMAQAVDLQLSHLLFWMPRLETILNYGDQAYSAQTITALGESIFVDNPDFMRPAWGDSGDYRLQLGSPAIDSGMFVDMDNENLGPGRRFQGSAPDLGAYETPGLTVVSRQPVSTRPELVCYPNPANPGARLSIQLPARTRAGLTIYNLLGHPVRRFAPVPHAAGAAIWNWDGCSDTGHRCTSGVYIAVVTTPQNRYVKRVLKIR